jgi:hypothetical protein
MIPNQMRFKIISGPSNSKTNNVKTIGAPPDAPGKFLSAGSIHSSDESRKNQSPTSPFMLIHTQPLIGKSFIGIVVSAGPGSARA